MEIFILVAIVFIFWTNEVLLGNKLFKEKAKPSDLDKLADALKKYLDGGINVNVKGGGEAKK